MLGLSLSGPEPGPLLDKLPKLAVTLLLTVFRELTEAIVVGFAFGAGLFIHHISTTAVIETAVPVMAEGQADENHATYDEAAEQAPGVAVYRISGAFFFGAAATIGTVLHRIADQHQAMVVDFTAVPFVDATVAATIDASAAKAAKRGLRLVLIGTSHDMRRDLIAHGIVPPRVKFSKSIETARGLF